MRNSTILTRKPEVTSSAALGPFGAGCGLYCIHKLDSVDRFCNSTQPVSGAASHRPCRPASSEPPQPIPGKVIIRTAPSQRTTAAAALFGSSGLSNAGLVSRPAELYAVMIIPGQLQPASPWTVTCLSTRLFCFDLRAARAREPAFPLSRAELPLLDRGQPFSI